MVADRRATAWDSVTGVVLQHPLVPLEEVKALRVRISFHGS